MVVALKKPAAKAAAKPKAKDETCAKVDRMVELEALIKSVAPAQKELSEIEAELKAEAAKRPDDEPVVFAGTKYNYCLNPKRMMRTIKDPKHALDTLIKAIGPEKAFELIKITLGDLDKYLSEGERAKLITEARTGARTGALLPKG